FFERSNFARISTASAVFIAQQATGATAFAYFGPQYFKLLVGNSGNKVLLLIAVFALLSWRCTKSPPLSSSKSVPHGAPGHGQVTSSSIAIVALIYLFVIAYNLSLSALPWPYVSEIFPTRIREPGIAVEVSSQWLFSVILNEAQAIRRFDQTFNGTFLVALDYKRRWLFTAT
ncbi:hypothetical protein LTR04_003119, partial [Oleoguttula sp. CCFEE 6159]